MYQLLGDEVYQSEEVAEHIKNNSNIEILTDLTMSTKRDNAIAFKTSVSFDLLSSKNLDNIDQDVELADELMKKCDDYCDETLSDVLDNNLIFLSYSYKVDIVTKSVISILTIMDSNVKEKKIYNLARILLKNND